ncbi:5'-nucleotidase SurE [anaerobic digester metagenome]
MERTILITNDDGIDAPGIKFLITFLRPMGRIVVVAPETGMSGMGHAVTIKNPLRIQHLPNDGEVERYTTNGTPADCVKLGLNQILKQRPDLIVSGINHGSNHSINVLYSGTMAAAIEGAMQNIPSAGFSMCNPNPKIDFSFMESYVQEISERLMKNGLPAGTCINVNFPDTDKPAGVKVCRQSIGYWNEEFDSRLDVHHQPYYWLKGDFIIPEVQEDTDENALQKGYISIVPVTIDLTAHSVLDVTRNQFHGL